MNDHHDIQIFGITDYDQYWNKRKGRNRTYKTDIHRILIDIVTLFTPPNGRVLDLGVGPGHVFKELMGKFDMIGVEFSEEAFKLYDFDAHNIMRHDLQTGIPTLDGKLFDTIIASHIVHHMREPLSFIEQIHNVLKQNGILVLATQNISFIKYRLRYLIKGEFPIVSHGHINFISPYEYVRILKEKGFTIETIKTTGSHTFLNRFFPFWFSGTLFFVCRKS